MLIWRASTPALVSGAGAATAMPRTAERRARVNFIVIRFFGFGGNRVILGCWVEDRRIRCDCFGIESVTDQGLGRRVRGGFIYSHLTVRINRMTTQLKGVYTTVAFVSLPFVGGAGISFLFKAKGAEPRARRCLL